MENVMEKFGNIDIYLFDQIQKGRFDPGMRLLDAGCGGGRNSYFLMRSGFDVFGIDQNPEAIEHMRTLSGQLEKGLPTENFAVAPVEKMPFPDNHFDWVFSNAVLHFANDRGQFDQMVMEMWRVLKPNGSLFVRLASTIGIENLIKHTQNGRYDLPDGSERFLVSEDMLLSMTEKLGGQLLEPIKTTNVQSLRCMTTWVLTKLST